MGKTNLRIGTRGYYHKGIENQAGNWSSNSRKSQAHKKSRGSLGRTPESRILVFAMALVKLLTQPKSEEPLLLRRWKLRRLSHPIPVIPAKPGIQLPG